MKEFFRSKTFKIVLIAVVTVAICIGTYRLFIVPKQAANPQNPINGVYIVSSDGREIQAIYLVPLNGGEIREGDLKNHPEVLKVADFETLNSYTEKYIIPIWIDKDAIDLLPKNWINQYPQKFCPVIVVGYSKAFYAMREKLNLPIFGPYIDWSKQNLEPGFSVWMIKSQDSGGTSATMKGYDEPVSAGRILEVSNELFDECFKTLEYKNTQYGFTFSLPLTWKGFEIVEETWEGYATTGGNDDIIETGPELLIRHPKWTSENPRQDIPIMIFTPQQWQKVQQEKLAVSAAGIGPTELGHNLQYVFALPARYNFAFLPGWEEVDEIMKANPLKAF